MSNDVNIPKLSDFKTRKEFNDWKQKITSFTSRSNQEYQFRKNEYGVVASVKELNEIKRNTKKAQKIAKEKIDKAMKLDFYVEGERQGKVKDRIKLMKKEEVAGVSVPVDFDFDKIQTRKRLEDKAGFMEERATGDYYRKKDIQMKENFISMIQQGFNSDADEVIEKLKKIPPDDFVELTIVTDEIDFRNYSSKNEGGINDEDKLEELNNTLNDYFNGKISMKLKNF